MDAAIRSIYRYPVKGLSAETLDRVGLQVGECLPHDRRFAIVRRAQQLLESFDLFVQIRAERHSGVRERLGHVHDKKRRPLPESKFLSKASLLKEFSVRWNRARWLHSISSHIVPGTVAEGKV